MIADTNAEVTPSVLVLGVGHSGTSLVTKMLFTLGWRRNGAEEAFCETEGLRTIDDAYLLGTDPELVLDRARDFLAGLERPFALKDPRLTMTLPLWIAALAGTTRPPLLLRLTRDRDALAASYRDRNELFEGDAGMYGRSLDELIALSEASYAAWPYAKATIRYEDVVAAAGLVRTQRAMSPKGGLWLSA